MGVPAFFRWLSKKYPSIVVHCVEEKAKEVNGQKVPVDSSQPNPNDYEFDNLYLDMNGIIHPCCHPEDKPAPKNEDEMMVLIFEYIDRLFSIVRPRKLLYMAIDGVAPRAKMNQQRSRRFRASKESAETKESMARIREELEAKGCRLPPPKPAGEHFDSNCITPGTPFMFRLADCLRFYIHDRLNNDPGWQNIKVILSDANVPGEGEHKIMDYIRKQRAQPDHDPNTKHCLCGADADLIMLGLATHEPYFTIIREEFKPNQPKPCELCGQIGHELKDCNGLPREESGENSSLFVGQEQQFIFLRLNILRESIEREMVMTNLSFPYDFERALDDWVFMCFFVGNDFLPHLPSLEIREGAIDRLIRLYKNTVRKTGGYLTESGVVNLKRVQVVLQDLGEMEDEIFKNRRQTELDFRRRDREKRLRKKRMEAGPRWIPGGRLAPQPLGHSHHSQGGSRPRSNEGAAAELRAMMRNPEEEAAKQGVPKTQKQEEEEEEKEPEDEVKLWEDGWKDRYYQSKFNVSSSDVAFRHNVANHYVRGLCWVLRYYYQGCPSWKWYFPYHYAPFASDFVNIGDLSNSFDMDTEPFKPLEQLMGVFPAASRKHLPVTWQRLMTDPESPIIDFYPLDFRIDLNGKKYAWQGVALLPFVEEKRLLSALATVYPDLTSEERKRNTRGSDKLFVGMRHPAYTFFEGLYEGEKTTEPVSVDPKLSEGMAGLVWASDEVVLTGQTVKSPLDALCDVPDNRAICVNYSDLKYEKGFVFPSKILPNAKLPPKILKPEDFERMNPGRQWRPQIGMAPNSGYRDHSMKNPGPALRMIGAATGSGYHMPQRGGYHQGGPGRDNQGNFGGRQPMGGQSRNSYGNQGHQGNYGSYGNQQGHYGNQRSNYGNQQNSYGNQHSNQRNSYDNQRNSYGYVEAPRSQNNYGSNQGGYNNDRRQSGYSNDRDRRNDFGRGGGRGSMQGGRGRGGYGQRHQPY